MNVRNNKIVHVRFHLSITGVILGEQGTRFFRYIKSQNMKEINCFVFSNDE